jgi:hypothetical protein
MVKEVKVTQYECEKCGLIGADKSELESHESIPLKGIQIDMGGIYGLNEVWKSQTFLGSFVVVDHLWVSKEDHRYGGMGDVYSISTASHHAMQWIHFKNQLRAYTLEKVICELDKTEFQEAFDAMNQKYDHQKEEFAFDLGRTYSELDKLNALNEYIGKPLIELVHGKIRNSD